MVVDVALPSGDDGIFCMGGCSVSQLVELLDHHYSSCHGHQEIFGVSTILINTVFKLS